MNEKALKLYFYVDGVNDTPFPTASSQIEITDFTYDAKRMGGAPLISCEVMYPTCLDDVWTDNVYAMFNGEKYFLKQTPTSSFSNTDSRYKHEVELVSERVILDNVYFFDVVASNVENDKPVSNSSVVNFHGDVHEFAKRLNYSLQYTNLQEVDEFGLYVSGYRVIVDDDVTTDSELMSFENQFMSNVLQEIYNTFEIPYYFVGKEIHIGYSPNKISTVFQYGVDDALLSIQKSNANHKIVNRASGIGSPDNIPYYYPNETSRGNVTILYNDLENYAYVANPDTISNFSLTDTLEYTVIKGYTKDYATKNLVIWNGILSGNFSSLGIKPESGINIEQYAFHFYFTFEIDEIGSDVPLYIDINNGDSAKIKNSEVVKFYKVEKNGDDLLEQGYTKFDGKYVNGTYRLYYYVRTSSLWVDAFFAETGRRPTYKDYIVKFIPLEVYQKDETNQEYWQRNGEIIKLKNLGVELYEGVVPKDGDTIKLRQDRYIAPQINLMPPIYRESLGAERFYNALNETYIDPESKFNEYYHFKNPYIDGKPKEQLVNFENIHPTIVGMDNANGKLIGMFTEFAYDYDDNDDTEEIDGTVHYKHPFFFGKLRKFDGDFGFNLFDHSIEEDEMVIAFTDGSCGGCEFAIVVNENQENTVQVYEEDFRDENGVFYAKGSLKRDRYGNVLCGREEYQSAQTAQAIQNDTLNNEVWVALRKDDKTFGMLMPKAPKKDLDGNILEAGIRPKADTNNDNTGDKFAILHINLPQAYILDAEDRLKDAIIKYMSENNVEKFNFSIDFSRIYLANNPDIFAQLNENSHLTIRYNGYEIPLYVSSYSYRVSSDQVLPQISVELSENITVSQNVIQNTISELKIDMLNLMEAYNGNSNTSGSSVDNRYLDKFLRKDVDDVASGLITFTSGVNFGENAAVMSSGNAKFKRIESTEIETGRAIIDKENDGIVLSSSTFDGSSALAGFGYGILKDGFDYRLAIDYLTVRKGMTVAELVIQEYKSVGGVLVLSACNGEVDYVNWDSESDNGNPIYIVTTKDWERKPQFDEGDIVRCSRWDNTTNKLVYYIGSVWDKDNDILYIEILEGNGIPQVGDNLVQFGSTTNTLRQGLIIISTEEGKPNITLYDGLNSADVNMLDKMTARLGNLNGIVKDDKELSGYGLWTNNLYIVGQAKNAFESLIDGVFAEYKQEIDYEFEVTNQGFSSVQRSVTQLKDGSRNLLLATNQGATGWKPSDVYSVDGVKGEYTAFTREVYSSENHYEFLCFDLRPELIQNGKQYLLSFEIYLPEDYSNVDNVTLTTAFASRSFTDVLSYSAHERNNQKPQVGSWVKMEYVITANASGAKDDATSIYISIARVDYNKFQYFYIRNLQLLERTVDSTTAVSDDEFLPWRPALEDANNYADLVAEQAKETAIKQTMDKIELKAYATTTDVGGMIKAATADIKIEAGKISQSVSDLKKGVDGQISGLESKIEQTASNISLKVKELGVSNLNYAYGTGKKVEITSLANINNQSVNLYDVTGLVGGDKISISFTIGIKNIIFDNDTASANNMTSDMHLQLGPVFGYMSFKLNITENTFKDENNTLVAPDANGYRNARLSVEGLTLPKYSFGTETVITPDMVGSVFLRLDFIDSETDDNGNDIGSIIIKELKIERGTECTAWTSRTQDMDTALLDTGIDIESKVITATADKFQIKNNAGFVTASVDEQGRLVTSTVQCRNMESTTSDATKFVTTINEYNNNGWITFYYPLDTENAIGNKAFEIGWDDVTSSMMRFYNKSGVMTWKAGSESNLISTLPTEEKTKEEITEAKLYRTRHTNKLAAGNAIKVSTMLPNNAGIWEKKVYRYTASATTLVGTSYYTDATCNTPVNSEEYFTDSGSPQFVIGSQGTPQSYKRSLFKIMNGQKSEVETIKWLANESLNDTFIPLPTSN